MPEIISDTAILLAAAAMLYACSSKKNDEIYQPIPVSTMSLKWHSEDIPDRLLVLRGYYSRQSESGVANFYASKIDAEMVNSAAGFPVSLVESNIVDNATCDDGYMKAFGYLDRKYGIFQVFVMSSFAEDWQEEPPCWSTDFAWREDPNYKHLLPDKMP
jgi:hypothetical protein